MLVTKKQIHEKHIYQLFATVTHYRYQLREALVLRTARQKESKTNYENHENFRASLFNNRSIRGGNKSCKTLLDYLQTRSALKDYPMVKCNITKHTGEKLYHLPFDKQYDSIIIGNVNGERYVNSVAEAEEIGFRRVGYAN